MTATIINLQVARVMIETHDAFSRPAFGDAEWAKCAAILLDAGHTVDEAAALLASRLTRWAREDAADYDAPTAGDFARFLASPAGINALAYELAA